MTDQLARQVVVVPQEAQDPSRMSEKLALFNPDGTPLVPVQGSVTPEYPKLIAAWVHDDATNRLLLEPGEGQLINTFMAPLNGEFWEESVSAQRYLDPDTIFSFPGDELIGENLLTGGFSVGFIPIKNHVYQVHMNCGTPSATSTHVADEILNPYVAVAVSASFDPDPDLWENESGTVLGIVYTKQFMGTFSGSQLGPVVWNDLVLQNFKFTSIFVSPPDLTQKTLQLEVRVMFIGDEFDAGEQAADVSTLVITVVDLGPLWPEA